MPSSMEAAKAYAILQEKRDALRKALGPGKENSPPLSADDAPLPRPGEFRALWRRTSEAGAPRGGELE